MIAAFAVVGQHSVTWLWVPEVADWAANLQKAVTLHLKFAVPLFLALSGYWFMKSYVRYGYLQLLCRKIRSLYVPFLLCCVIGEIAVWATSLWASTSPSFKGLLYAPFLVTKDLNLAFHLWYIRALLIIFIAAPLFWHVSRRPLLIVLAFVATRFFPVVEAGPYCFQCIATVIPYFLLGAALSERDWLAIRLSPRISLCITLTVALFLLALDCCTEWRIPHVVDSQELRAFLCTAAVWFAYDALPMPKKTVNWLKYSFFIYLVHVSVIRFSGNIFRVAFDPYDPCVRTVGYVANFLVFFAALGMGWLCERYLPRLYRLLSGGRG